MRGNNNLALVCLLVASGFSAYSTAARSVEQGKWMLDNQHVILPTENSPLASEAPWPGDAGLHKFTLRHIYHHGTYRDPILHRYIDIPRNVTLSLIDDDGRSRGVYSTSESFSAKAVPMNIQRMADRSRSTVDDLLDHAAFYGEAVALPTTAWTVDRTSGPDTTDKPTVLSFARMAANAYETEPFKGDWQNATENFNHSEPFGWEMDGLRGHIFADETNSTVVIAFKGTSMAVWDGAGTTTNDKVNDNTFASCCCGEGVHYSWKTVCNCKTSAFTCNSTCVVKNLRKKDHYYSAARNLYHNVTSRYPGSEVWLTGHSLGGVVSALLGLTYGCPVMTYEAYPDALAASRLGLPVPPGYRVGSYQPRTDLGIYHYGHTADPVFTGTCDTAFSTCSLAGYAMEGSCHTGNICQYDTVNDFGWRSSARTHSILKVIENVLEKYDTVPTCEQDRDCSDCYAWKFFKSNGTDNTTTTSISMSSTTSRVRTRTETCKTPGWWGCRDETMTSDVPTTTTSSSSSSTCKTPGWFGCRDITTTTSSSLTATTPEKMALPIPTTAVAPRTTIG